MSSRQLLDRDKMVYRSRVILGGACLILLYLLHPELAFGQQEAGSFFYSDHFAPQEYQGHQTNWAVAQHPDGMIYVANDENGVLEYDGVRWRQIEMPTRTTVRSLDVDSDGTVYVGTGGDFGYLAPDSLGNLEFLSLIDHLEEEDYGFSDVWGTHAIESGVYFQTRSVLFKWDGNQIQSWKSEDAMHTSFQVMDDVFIRTVNRGLMTVEGDSLALVPGGEAFENRAVFSVDSFGEDALLVATRSGFYLYDGEVFTPFDTELDEPLSRYDLYHGTSISDSTYAYSLIGDGVYVMDHEGVVLRHLSTGGELPDDEVNFLFADQEDGLWMALHSSGIYRTNVNTGLSKFDGERGPSGIISSIQRFRGSVVVATASGLYSLEEHGEGPLHGSEFAERIVPRNIHTIRPFGRRLLIASDHGLDIWDGSSEERIMSGSTFSLSVLDHNQLVAVGHASGLGFMFPFANGPEFEVEQVEHIDREIRSIQPVGEGELWAASGRRVVYRIKHDEGEVLSVERFDENHGVPDEGMTLTSVGDVPFIASRAGSFRFSESEGRFVPDATIIADDKDAPDFLSAGLGPDDRFYLVYPDRVEIVDPAAEGDDQRIAPPALKSPRARAVQTFVDDSGVLWISDDEELVRYDPASPMRYKNDIRPLIRSAEDAVTGAQVFGGARGVGQLGEKGTLELPYTQNTLRIAYAQPEFNVVSPIEYQFRTVGASEEWSDWEETTSTTLSALTEGNYRFEVRARNERGVISEPVSLSLQILPPWYRTWWAYASYLLLAVFCALAVRQYRELAEAKRKSRQQAEELARERLLTERLKQANESLEQANKLKETFLANTSHELRTPLTAILGFASVLKEEADGRHREFLGIIEENGERLLSTLNALLDLAKIRAGIEEPELQRIDVAMNAQGVVRMMRPLAENKSLDLNYEGPSHGIYCMLDEGHLRRILQNLVGNAVKFTEEGHVTVRVEVADDMVHTRVVDTGIGIREEFLPNLFDEFEQESSGVSREFEGTGLGLAISSRLAEVMKGSISVESTKNVGSVFTVTFELAAERGPDKMSRSQRSKEAYLQEE